MTTEIAVSNRLGIALATDSAVTISHGGGIKVFNTADKLFELSSKHPVAVMINGNMECLGVPWEILAKDFRQAQGDTPRPNIKQWLDDFLSYVEGHLLISVDAIERYIYHVATVEIEAVQARVRGHLHEYIFRSAAKQKYDIASDLKKTIEERLKYLEEYPISISLEHMDPIEISKAYSPVIVPLLIEKFGGQILPDDIVSLESVVVESLRRSLPSDLAAQIVVAGFGTDDTFPCLHAVEVDGRVLDRLKIGSVRSESIIKSPDGGQVTYFAQTDVIQRLLGGADPRFVDATAKFIKRAVVHVAGAVESGLRPRARGKPRSPKRQRLLNDIVDLVTTEYEEQTTKKLREEFSREFDRMVAMMPKQELIELAEALVSITAVERKATSDAGTVGGPIDVAFITKHEGFVWIKRKHYFERDLNPRYFWRKYGSPPSRGSAP